MDEKRMGQIAFILLSAFPSSTQKIFKPLSRGPDEQSLRSRLGQIEKATGISTAEWDCLSRLLLDNAEDTGLEPERRDELALIYFRFSLWDYGIIIVRKNIDRRWIGTLSKELGLSFDEFAEFWRTIAIEFVEKAMRPKDTRSR